MAEQKQIKVKKSTKKSGKKGKRIPSTYDLRPAVRHFRIKRRRNA